MRVNRHGGPTARRSPVLLRHHPPGAHPAQDPAGGAVASCVSLFFFNPWLEGRARFSRIVKKKSEALLYNLGFRACASQSNSSIHDFLRHHYVPGEDPVPPKQGDVGLVCQIDDVYHDNKVWGCARWVNSVGCDPPTRDSERRVVFENLSVNAERINQRSRGVKMLYSLCCPSNSNARSLRRGGTTVHHLQGCGPIHRRQSGGRTPLLRGGDVPGGCSFVH